MSRDPDYFRTVSLKLSDVLCDIGVNKRMVMKRRRMVLLLETIQTTAYRLLGEPATIYNFGSRSEGSTTIGLHSDADTLFCLNMINVIQDWSEWQPGVVNLLMIQDETTSPGYCLLQMLRAGEPLPIPIPLPELDTFCRYKDGSLLLKNTINRAVALPGDIINGPAASSQGWQGFADYDRVPAFHCNAWPEAAQAWLERQGIGRWPTEEMKRYCAATECFVVPVSSKSGQNEELEWRISTSLAERCLMFSLNITQMRCYILMKMILKTFINPQCNGVLSSFMCKTVLFHCIQNTHSNNWQHSNLLPCLICCLILLQNFVRQENCPHFIIPENNLMARKISPLNRYKIFEILQNIIQSDGRALLQIPIDDLGTRLQGKMNMHGAFQAFQVPGKMYASISSWLVLDTANVISSQHTNILTEILHDGNENIHERLSDFMFTLTRTYTAMRENSLEKSAFELFTPPLYSSLGSVMASGDIYTNRHISREALACFSIGLNSDVSSGRLKLASALYCVGDMNRTEFVLRNTVDLYDLDIVESVCCCYRLRRALARQGFEDKSDTGNEEALRHIAAFCVRFTRCEIHCLPQELRYEMFRSTQEDMIDRDERIDCWMDWAVVDSLPYLYFLQYKTYGRLQRADDQQRALTNLVGAIEKEPNLGHRETALNLLGQCMEQENRHTDALRCYMLSLNIRARNNAANLLICKLLSAFANRRIV